jgi:hypothetical protein
MHSTFASVAVASSMSIRSGSKDQCLGPNGGSRNCSEPNGAPGFAQPNGGFTGLTVGARELTHRIALCKTFIYIYTILWTVRPYSRCWVRMTSDCSTLSPSRYCRLKSLSSPTQGWFSVLKGGGWLYAPTPGIFKKYANIYLFKSFLLH